MKKSFVMLPLVALMLSACSSTTSNPEVPPPAPVVSVPTPAWQNQEIQPMPMPSTMTQPVYQAAQQVQQPLPQQPMPTVQMPQTNAYGQVSQIGACQVVRDNLNAPVYSQIQKGCYTDASYTVNKGDTVFLVSYLAGKSVTELARLNNLVEPYQLTVGQVLRLK